MRLILFSNTNASAKFISRSSYSYISATLCLFPVNEHLDRYSFILKIVWFDLVILETVSNTDRISCKFIFPDRNSCFEQQFVTKCQPNLRSQPIHRKNHQRQRLRSRKFPFICKYVLFSYQISIGKMVSS